MSRYIDADPLCESLKESQEMAIEWNERANNANDEEGIIRSSSAIVTFSECKLRIDAQPTADVVPVVRCKNCVWYKADNHSIGFCNFTDHVTAPEKYCSDGEKVKENGII